MLLTDEVFIPFNHSIFLFRQISPIDLLKIRSNGVPDNPEIIKVVEELKIYANKPPDCELINEEKLLVKISYVEQFFEKVC